MKALRIEDYKNNLGESLQSIKLEEIPQPEPGDHEVLIKMIYSPCNPSDIAFIRGMYNIKKPVPAIIGFEGCGRVVKAGKNADVETGQMVSCFTQEENSGTWAEFVVTKSVNCIPVTPGINEEQAACLFVNPFTAFAMFELAKEKKADTIVINAATSQVGNFIRTFAKNEGIEVINLVRRRQHVDLLASEGNKFVINTRDGDFSPILKEYLSKSQNAIAFDAVGGETTSIIFKQLPEGSTLAVYGGLSGLPVSDIDVLDLIFNQKQIQGFNVNHWIASKSRQEFLKISKILQEKILSGEIWTSIQNKVKPREAGKGIYQYITRMSEGKVLIDWNL